MEKLRVAIVLFPGFTGLDAIGPHEVLNRAPLHCWFVAEGRNPIAASQGLRVVPDFSFEECPEFDVLLVPGGPGQTASMSDQKLLSFIATRAQTAKYVAGVCTGTLLLLNAGVTRGRRVTTHWLAMHELRTLGGEAVSERVVWDGNLVTGAGVSSGIDLALALVERLFGRREAERVQLSIEYDPMPIVNAGSPGKAPPELVEELKASSRFRQAD